MKHIRTYLIGFMLAIISAAPASQAALAAGGPAQWCPGITTTPNSAGCNNFDTIQAAVNKAKQVKKPGHIYLWGGQTFDEPNISISGLKMVSVSGGADTGLVTTINGALNIDRSSAILMGRITVRDGVTVTHHKGPLYFNDVTGSIDIRSSRLTSGTYNDSTGTRTLPEGLYINTLSGPITLTGVTATRALGLGADIYASSAYPVTISQSHFDKNGEGGLSVTTAGAVTLTDITATGNQQDGVFVQSGMTLTITTEKSRTNRFDSNGGDGLIGFANNGITANDISASKNIGNGATLINDLEFMTISTNRGKRNAFDKNGGYGLDALATGPITAIDLSASGNASYGASLISGDAIGVGTWAGKLNSFDKNGGSGLVVSPVGDASVSDISARGNAGMGLSVESPTSVWLITVRAKQNTITGNKSIGAKLVSFNPLYISNTTVSKNGGIADSGLWLDSNDHPIKLACVKVTSNPGTGITFDAGTVAASFASIFISDNGTAFANNGTAAPVTITVTCPAPVE